MSTLKTGSIKHPSSTGDAITLDASDNVLIGKTSTGITSAGTSIKSDGTFELRRDLGVAGSSSVGYISRGSTDGNILTFYKDTTSVGSIGVDSGDQFYFAAADGMGIKVDSDNTSVEASNASGADNDATVNLGASGNRWKDLYLSGSVYLGGTGSANALDDYEKGTWTPTFQGSVTNPTVSYSSTVGEYVKIGKLVHVSGRIYVTSSSGLSGNLLIGNLPFTVICTSSTENSPITVGASFGSGWTTTTIAPQGGFVNHNQTRATLIAFDSSDPRDGADTRLTNLPANAGMIFSITYYTT